MRAILIIGGGLAGATAAQTLRAAGFDGRLTMVGDEACAPYDRTTLSKAVLVGDAERAPSLLTPQAFEGLDLEWLAGARIQELDPGARRVRLEGAWLEADGLLIATGASARRLRILGESLAGVHHLRSQDDGLALREGLKPGLRLLIVGGGLIGCEVATAAVKRGLRVSLIEAEDELLLRALGPELGRACRDRMEAMGVAVHLRSRLSEIRGGDHVESATLASGEQIGCDRVLISIGAIPNVGLAQAAGLKTSNGILVENTGVTDAPGVYAAGDAAAWPLREGPPRSVETYLNAESQARSAAMAMLGQGQPALKIPLGWTEIAGQRIQTAGVIHGPGELVWRGGSPGSDFRGTAFRIHHGRVAACASVDAPREFAVARRLAEATAEVQAGVLMDLSVDLRRALPRAA
jgi:biphenyl 2,3-dioxygenase ferredoxin reductase subunit